MRNSSNSDMSAKIPHGKIKGKTNAKHRMIAELIARGFPVKDVAQKVNLSASQIYHLLSDADSIVNAEINRILRDMFTENDRHLIHLYRQVLQKLDNMISGSDEEKQFRAIDKITKIYFSRSAKNAVTVLQYFGIQPQTEQEFIKSIDDLILKTGKEKGLPEFPEGYLQQIISRTRKARGLPELPDHDIQDIISMVLKEPEVPDLPDHMGSTHSSQELIDEFVESMELMNQ